MQDAQCRPLQKSAGVKEILQSHPYVTMEAHEQVQLYRVRLLIWAYTL